LLRKSLENIWRKNAEAERTFNESVNNIDVRRDDIDLSAIINI